jgi:hypothetical protein
MKDAYTMVTFKRIILHHAPEPPTNAYQIIRIRNALGIKFPGTSQRDVELGRVIDGDENMLALLRLLKNGVNGGTQYEIEL